MKTHCEICKNPLIDSKFNNETIPDSGICSWECFFKAVQKNERRNFFKRFILGQEKFGDFVRRWLSRKF